MLLDQIGANYQIFTQKIGVDALPVPLTSDAHDHDIPQVSGDRVVWKGLDVTTANYQIFRAKLITTPTITRTPSASSVTFRRSKGVAHYAPSATLRDADGTFVGGALVYLQTSANGTTKWKNSYTLSHAPRTHRGPGDTRRGLDQCVVGDGV